MFRRVQASSAADQLPSPAPAPAHEGAFADPAAWLSAVEGQQGGERGADGQPGEALHAGDPHHPAVDGLPVDPNSGAGEACGIQFRSGQVEEFVGEFAVVMIDGEDPWDFPRSALPEGVCAGHELSIPFLDGRPDIDQITVVGSASHLEVTRRLTRLSRIERLTGHSVG